MPELTGDPKQHDPASFGDKLTGTCLCGSIRVTITDSELWTKPRGHLCHCANCRKISGSCVASNLNIGDEKVQVEDLKGTLKKSMDLETGSGIELERWFCVNMWLVSDQKAMSIAAGR
jgi:hypothetical protein